MSNVLVTGGAGFIGSNFIHYLLGEYPEVSVVNLDRLTYAASLENLKGLEESGRYRLVLGDVADRVGVEALFAAEGFDTVVHFAAESHVDRSITDPEAFVRTNVVGTWNLLEAARRHWRTATGWREGVRFCHVSTDEVYGSLGNDDPAFTEESPYRPNSPYSASKASSDHFVRSYFHTFGLPVVTTNCSNNFGPRQHAEKLIPTVLRHGLAGKPIPVYGNGRNVRDWLYVLDHCRALDQVMHRGQPGRVYNIGADNEWANLDLVERIGLLLDEEHPEGAPHRRLITFVTDRPGHDWRYAVNSSRLRAELGWRPRESFDEALRATIRWYMAKWADALPVSD
ncbi:MAG: dTDP-glucose 4,6-dehydratase [Magnetococcales bacterium]|nr:dTDP-glucose 4,6-dehydratase [Magnetococcales bacterium]